MKMFLSTVGAAVLADLLVSAGAAQLRSGSVNSEGFFSYDYSKHGQDWMAGSCSSRSRQSPIDLPPTAPVTGTFAFKYNPIRAPYEVVNNGHAFSADVAGLGYGGITYDNAWYNLLNINVHAMSEHAWGGVRKPLELHLVHKRYDGEALLIIAVAIEAANPPAAVAKFLQVNGTSSVGLRKAKKAPYMSAGADSTYSAPLASEPNFNPQVQMFLKVEPPAVNMKVRMPADNMNPLMLNDLMQGGAFYEYAGSLTAPPCAEIATWLVRKDALMASDKQVAYLHDAVYKSTADFGNYRALMPVNGRAVNMRQALLEDLPPAAKPAVQLPGRPQQSDREFRAMKWAMDAMTIAKSSTDYIKDLDTRLRNAALAHAEALAAPIEPLGEAGAMGPGGAGAAPGMKGAAGGYGEVHMEKTAETMARALADAARSEIEDASQEISVTAKKAALQAAREAAGMVMTGRGDPLAMAKTVHTPGQPAPGQPVPAVASAGGAPPPPLATR